MRTLTRFRYGAFAVACAVAPCAANAQFTKFNVLDKITTHYNVDRNNTQDTRAISQWVQATWLNMGEQKFAAMYWTETSVSVEHPPIKYSWGPPPSMPDISGWFRYYPWSGSPSTIVWTVTSNTNSYTVASAPASFEVYNCFLTCDPVPLHTVNKNSNGGSTASFHVPSGGSAGGGSRLAATTPTAAEALPIEPGEKLEALATIDSINAATDEHIDTLFEFSSTVEINASGQFVYTYTATNNSMWAMELDWLIAGLVDMQLGAAGGNNTAMRTLVSSFAPIQQNDAADLLVLSGSGSIPLSGPVPTYAPVPLPAPIVLLSSALLALCGMHRRRDRADARNAIRHEM